MNPTQTGLTILLWPPLSLESSGAEGTHLNNFNYKCVIERRGVSLVRLSLFSSFFCHFIAALLAFHTNNQNVNASNSQSKKQIEQTVYFLSYNFTHHEH
jgi:hypothetical protein